MDALLQDLRYAVRTLARTPGFTAVAVLTLALGIGATTGIFSIVNGVLLRDLPFGDPERLVRVHHANVEQGVTAGPFSPPDYEDVEASAAGFESLAAYMYMAEQSGVNLVGEGDPLRVQAAYVTGDFFSTLGVGAAVGRPLAPEEDVAGADGVVVLSHGLWRERFSSDPSVVGRTVILSGEPFVVVGVMPEWFGYPQPEVSVWLPLSLIREDDIPRLRGLRWLNVVGRLRAGVSAEAAAAETGATLTRLAEAHPESNEGWERANVVPLRESMVGDVRPALLVLLGAVALVLLIASANVANLLLARGAGRSRDLAIRVALGAQRRGLVRQLAVENLVLTAAGGAVGLLVAVWVTAGLLALGGSAIPRAEGVGMDARVLAFALGATLAAAAVAAVFPVLQSSRVEPHLVLKESGRGGGAGRSSQRSRAALVVAETALAVVLLAGAGLMLRSVWRLVHVDPGLRAEGVLVLSMNMGDDVGDRRDAYRERILRRLETLPGVTAVGAMKTLPLRGGGEPYEFSIDGASEAGSTLRAESGAMIVWPGTLQALGIPLLEGRTLDDRDDTSAATVALVIDRTLARRYWPGESAVGKTLEDGAVTVVGVVGDVRHEGLSVPAGGSMYVSMRQFPRSASHLVVRTSGDPLALAGPARAAVHELMPAQPVSNVAPLQDLVAETVARPRLLGQLLGLFAALALGLAALGVYGVQSYVVGQRTREIGIQLALGAARRAVLRQVIGQAVRLAAAGLALGIAGALVLTRLLAGLLYELSPLDPLTYAAVALVLTTMAVLAAWLPARRAAAVDPMVALRME